MDKVQSTLETYNRMTDLVLRGIEYDLGDEYIVEAACFSETGDKLNQLYADIEKSIQHILDKYYV
mgnify:CR=1 FL=1